MTTTSACTEPLQLPPGSKADDCQLPSRCLPLSAVANLPALGDMRPISCRDLQNRTTSLSPGCCVRPLTPRGPPQCSLHLAGEEGGAVHQAMRIQAVTPEVGARPGGTRLGTCTRGGGGGVCSHGLLCPPNHTHLCRSTGPKVDGCFQDKPWYLPLDAPLVPRALRGNNAEQDFRNSAGGV